MTESHSPTLFTHYTIKLTCHVLSTLHAHMYIYPYMLILNYLKTAILPCKSNNDMFLEVPDRLDYTAKIITCKKQEGWNVSYVYLYANGLIQSL